MQMNYRFVMETKWVFECVVSVLSSGRFGLWSIGYGNGNGIETESCKKCEI